MGLAKKGATTKNQRRAAKAAAAAAAAAAVASAGSAAQTNSTSTAPRPSSPEAGVKKKTKLKKGSARVSEIKGSPSKEDAHLTHHEHKLECHYGPPVGIKTMVNDEWQTCHSAWEALVPIFGTAIQKKCIWQPFFYDGECKKHLEVLGFTDVVHTSDDFFVKVKDKKFMKKVDLIWDNPPYTNQDIKEKVLRALSESGKPFCVLLPLSILHAQFARDILDTKAIQVVIPRKVLVKKKNQNPVPFKYLVWLCYKVGLEKDLYML